MDTRTFLEAVLGDEGTYCVWANRITDGRKVQKFYPTIEALIHAANNLDEDGYDAYFALGTFDEAGSREGSHVKQLRAFFLDLDCGPTKEYASQSEALTALRSFCKQVKLPRPTLINSGRGVHVYWALTAPVSRETWQPVAERLKALCKQHKLYADPVVTADAARVLRVPGTHNHKDTPPTEVIVVGEAAKPVDCTAFSELLGDVAVVEDIFKGARNKFVPRENDALMQALSGSFVSRFKTIMLKTVAGKGCAQLAEVVQNQENISEPLWRAGLSIAKFCVDGGTAIHRISNKHPQYTENATEEKAARIQGPYLCERFDEYRAGVCPTCPHWGKIKSPISLGREIEEASEDDNVVIQKPLGVTDAVPIKYVIPKYPAPFFRGKSGGVFRRGKQVFKENGEVDEEASKDKLVYFNDLYVVRRLKDPEMGESLVMRLHLPKDGVREFTLPLTAVGSKDEFRKYLAMQGVAVLGVAELMEYTMQWVNNLQLTTEAEEARRQFGWVDEKYESFALGNMLVYKDRVEVNAPSGATVGLFPYFQPKGTLAGWKETMKFYDRPGMEPHQFMVGLAFGAVLMEFQPINAAAFHMYSKESGLGKTTGMLAGASVWGDPDLLMMQERDTINSKMNRAEVYKNVVCYMDELTNTKPQDLSDWAYQLPSGLQRNRMGPKNNVERVRGKPWKTLFGTTGNTSMLERIALYKALPKAEAQRILEHRVERLNFASKSETDAFATAIKENYGVAGVPYLQYLLNDLEGAKKLANAVQGKIDLQANLTAENRFWSVLVSRPIAGLMLARRAGLLDWKIEPIVKWAIHTMQVAQSMVREMNADVEAILTDYLAEHYNSMLRIKSTDDSRKGNTGLDHLIQPDAIPRGNSFIARYEYDVKKLYLLPKPLKEWCGKQQINYSGFIEGLKAGRTKATRTKIRLSKGTQMNLPPTDVFVLDCTEFMDDEAEQAMATTSALFQAQSSD
jgi:hypothetical protein